jgi:hypothetical protein
MAYSIFVEVEENDNAEYMPLMVYEAHADPVPVERVRVEDPGKPTGVYRVTGWSSEGGGSPVPALYVPVSDSGQALVHLVYGGDWGIRLMPEGLSEDWDIASPNQFGEPYLMLISEGDVLTA